MTRKSSPMCCTSVISDTAPKPQTLVTTIGKITDLLQHYQKQVNGKSQAIHLSTRSDR